MTTKRHAVDAPAPRLCLACARRKLAGAPEKPCGTCVLLNVDPMAQVRATAARPWPPKHWGKTHEPSYPVPASTGALTVFGRTLRLGPDA